MLEWILISIECAQQKLSDSKREEGRKEKQQRGAGNKNSVGENEKVQLIYSFGVTVG